ncbi:MAG TPA: hypothetical protein VN606_15060 [Thermoleophilaceae bacterium]|jgi:hypothetical protein|nr:hypothetical protein [Thermoleophilaceae bacterium]
MVKGGIRLALTVAGFFAAASPALATTIYSSPTSNRSTQPCASDTPCRLDYAIAVAGSGDDVSLAPGKYYETGTTPWPGLPPITSGVTLHGSDDGDLPVLFGHVFVNAHAFLDVQNGGAVRDVELRSDTEPAAGNFYGYTLAMGPTATADRVISRSTGTPGVSMTACSILGGTLTNSVCQGSGPGSVNAVGANSNQSTTYTLRNVTAYTTSGIGISFGTFNQNVTLNARNVIAHGSTYDINVVANDPAGVATANLQYSNWLTANTSGGGTHTIVPGPGNQTAAPAFVNAGAGDFRQVTGSPTIDGGLTDPGNGTLALGGLQRTLGLRTDIGAYEHVPAPAATTAAATNVTDGAAKLNGTVAPDGVAATARFDYGTTTAYGRTANATGVSAAQGTVPVSANLSGLAPDTTYHYRLAITAGNVTSRGQDRTFHTLAIPTGPQVTPTVVSAVTIGSRWRLGRKLPIVSRKRRPPVGTNIVFTLSRGSRVDLSFSQRVKSRCKHNRKRRCSRLVSRGRFSLAGYAGRNRVHFEGRISAGRRLKPGRFVLTVTPAGTNSSKTASFTIVP